MRQYLVMYTFFPGFSVFLFSIIGLGRNETVGEEQEKRWEMKRMKKGEQGSDRDEYKRKVMLIAGLPCEFIDSRDISSLICLWTFFPDDQES